MPDPDIAEALSAFYASTTAKTPKGVLVAAKLRTYQEDEEIEYAPLPGTTYGDSVAHRIGANVKVNDGYKGDIGTTSLVLAHEGVHRITNTHSFEEEVDCFDFQIQYFNELLKGVTYLVPGTSKTAIATTNPGIMGAPSETDRARTWAVKNQLVDFVLAKRLYQDKIDAGWVKTNIAKWGGLRNRWATSRGLFVRALAANGDQANGTLVLDILESAGTQPEWNELMRVVGDFGNVRKVLRNARNAMVAGNRMDALAKRWNIGWT